MAIFKELEKVLRQTIQTWLADHLPAEIPAWAQPFVDRARQGSYPAFLALQCCACQGWDPERTRQCRQTGCPIWLTVRVDWRKDPPRRLPGEPGTN